MKMFGICFYILGAFAKKNKHRTGGSGSSHNSRPTSKPQTHSGGSINRVFIKTRFIYILW